MAENERVTPAKRAKQSMQDFQALTEKFGGKVLTPRVLKLEKGELFVGKLISVEEQETVEKVKGKDGKITEEKRTYPVYHLEEVKQDIYEGSQNRGHMTLSGGVNLQEQMKKVEANDTVAVMYEGKKKTATAGRSVNIFYVSILENVK